MNILTPLLLIILLSGCIDKTSSSSVNPNEIQISSIRWGENELNEISHKIVDAILRSKQVDFSKKRCYYFAKIRNDSHDQIETNRLKNKIKSLLLKSTKLNITDDEQISDYLFKGKISSILKKNRNAKDMFFTFNLTLTQKEDAAIVWSHEVEIRKVYERALIAW